MGQEIFVGNLKQIRESQLKCIHKPVSSLHIVKCAYMKKEIEGYKRF